MCIPVWFNDSLITARLTQNCSWYSLGIQQELNK